MNLMKCNCVGAREFRETISSGVKKEEEKKKPDLPLGGCIKVGWERIETGKLGRICRVN